MRPADQRLLEQRKRLGLVFTRAENAERRVAACDRLIVGADETIDEAEIAAGPQHPWHDFEPLVDLARAKKIEREADRDQPAWLFLLRAPQRLMQRQPIALSASALISPP